MGQFFKILPDNNAGKKKVQFKANSFCVMNHSNNFWLGSFQISQISILAKEWAKNETLSKPSSFLGIQAGNESSNRKTDITTKTTEMFFLQSSFSTSFVPAKVKRCQNKSLLPLKTSSPEFEWKRHLGKKKSEKTQKCIQPKKQKKKKEIQSSHYHVGFYF